MSAHTQVVLLSVAGGSLEALGFMIALGWFQRAVTASWNLTRASARRARVAAQNAAYRVKRRFVKPPVPRPVEVKFGAGGVSFSGSLSGLYVGTAEGRIAQLEKELAELRDVTMPAKIREASALLGGQIPGVRLDVDRLRAHVEESNRRDYRRERTATAFFVLGLILSVSANIVGAP